MELTTSSQRASRAEYQAQVNQSNAIIRAETEAAERRIAAAKKRSEQEGRLSLAVEEAKIAEHELLAQASGPHTRLASTRTLIAECYHRAALADSQRNLLLCPVCNGRCDDEATLAHVPELQKRCEVEKKALAKLAVQLEAAGRKTEHALAEYKSWQAKNPPVY